MEHFIHDSRFGDLTLSQKCTVVRILNFNLVCTLPCKYIRYKNSRYNDEYPDKTGFPCPFPLKLVIPLLVLFSILSRFLGPFRTVLLRSIFLIRIHIIHFHFPPGNRCLLNSLIFGRNPARILRRIQVEFQTLPNQCQNLIW